MPTPNGKAATSAKVTALKNLLTSNCNGFANSAQYGVAAIEGVA